MENIFEVWIEGFQSMDGNATASYIGSYSGETFNDALLKAADEDKPADDRGVVFKKLYLDKQVFNNGNVLYTDWGRRLYNNETDARGCFG
jgi:hypothetical protein